MGLSWAGAGADLAGDMANRAGAGADLAGDVADGLEQAQTWLETWLTGLKQVQLVQGPARLKLVQLWPSSFSSSYRRSSQTLCPSQGGIWRQEETRRDE